MRRLWPYRHLILALTVREYQVRYRQSFVGLLWAFILPLATLGAGTLVFKEIAGVATEEDSYALSTLAALVPWSFFATALVFGVGSVVAQKGLVIKLAFPRQTLPLGMVGVSFVDLAISAGIYVVLAYLIGDGLPLTSLWVPILLTVEVALVVGLVLLGSAANVFARDIRLGIPLLVQLWLLLTPVLYPLSAVPLDLRPLYLANPMTGLVESFRRVLLEGRNPDFGLMLITLVWAVVGLTIGSWYFAATEKRFADVI
jgi:ABC-type polysaccharide/polyol phosphate export permease